MCARGRVEEDMARPTRPAIGGAGGREVAPRYHGARPHLWVHSDPPKAAHGGLATCGHSREAARWPMWPETVTAAVEAGVGGCAATGLQAA
jgi:hypothetical protein